MRRVRRGQRKIRGLSLSVLGVLILQSGQAETFLTTDKGDAEVNSYNSPTPHPMSPKYPDGIPEHQSNDGTFPIHPTINSPPHPDLQIGPGVVVGPNVLVRDKLLPNPLLKDVAPQSHP